jgi:Pathogenicity locus
MHPSKVDRDRLNALTDLPNIGKAGASDLRLLGFDTPIEIVGADPFEMFTRLCVTTGVAQDPCVLDVFIAVTRFLAGEDPQVWWHYTDERKQMMDRTSMRNLG